MHWEYSGMMDAGDLVQEVGVLGRPQWEVGYMDAFSGSKLPPVALPLARLGVQRRWGRPHTRHEECVRGVTGRRREVAGAMALTVRGGYGLTAAAVGNTMVMQWCW